jgi:hypothetical protein
MDQIDKALRSARHAIDERRSYPGRLRWTCIYKSAARRAVRRAQRLIARSDASGLGPGGEAIRETTMTHLDSQQLIIAAAEDGATDGRVDRECVLDNGLEPDEEMAREAMLENDLPEHPRLLRVYRRAYLAAFLDK